jgi:AcrR family transcriptional regulator
MTAPTQEIVDSVLGRRQAESERKRERILEAAQACLGELGYARATVTEIARRAGVSNGLLYQFFRNKEDLVERVLEETLRDWVREMVPREDESAPDALEGMFRRSVEFCRTHPLLPAFLRDDPELQLARLQSDIDVQATADVVCQLQSDYSGRAYRNDARFPDDPRIIDAVVDLIRAAVGTIGR